MSDAGDGLAEVKRIFADILETWFPFHFSSVNTSFYGP